VLAELNPRLVTLAISGFGTTARGRPRRLRPDRQGEGGPDVADRSGPDDPAAGRRPDRRPAGRHVRRYGVLAALLERERTGRGQVVRTSLLAGDRRRARLPGDGVDRWPARSARAQGNHHPSIAPYGLFHCAGGSVQVACASESLWRRLCAEFGLRPEAPDGDQRRARCARREEVIELLERTFADIPAEELLARLSKAGVPAGKVRTLDEVYSWDQVESQGLKISVEHATAGTLTLPGPPLRFFDAGPDGETETTRRDHTPPPVLGADGDAIRAWLTDGAATGAADGDAQTDEVPEGHAT
jgi:crotonobetainyl-CoA:carnitine CoA-transferase CaiB-like acyl-CoA transferase